MRGVGKLMDRAVRHGGRGFFPRPGTIVLLDEWLRKRR